MSALRARTPEEMETYWALYDMRSPSTHQIEMDNLEFGDRVASEFIWVEIWELCGG